MTAVISWFRHVKGCVTLSMVWGIISVCPSLYLNHNKCVPRDFIQVSKLFLRIFSTVYINMLFNLYHCCSLLIEKRNLHNMTRPVYRYSICIVIMISRNQHFKITSTLTCDKKYSKSSQHLSGCFVSTSTSGSTVRSDPIISSVVLLIS